MAATLPIPIEARAGYDAWAPNYALDANPLLALQERRLEPMLPPIRGRRVVDLACGTGRWLRRMATRAPKSLSGLDFSAGMLRRAAQDGLGGSLCCADCSAIPLRERCADVVLCSLAIDHIAHLQGFASEVARICDDGAVFLLSEFHPDAHRRGWKRTFHASGDTFELETHPRALSAVHEAMRSAGLQLDQCEEPWFDEPERAVFAAAGREDLFEAARSSGAALYICRYVRRRRAVTSLGPQLCIANARLARSASVADHGTLRIAAGKVVDIDQAETRSENAIDLAGYMILPGLVNAHDHLEFSLYPRLGRGGYQNARDWAADIYRPEESPIREHRRISKDVRLWWGALKNLLCGVTTVSHHNPHADVFQRGDFPVRVVAEYGWAHSFAEEPNVAGRFLATAYGDPFLIHLGEGIDDIARGEFTELQRAGALSPSTVVVHGIALSTGDYERLCALGASIVWCPSSNRFMFGRTLHPSTVASFPRMALGNDSALTAAGDILDEVGVALECGSSKDRVYEMVTSLAANVLHVDAGALLPNCPADFVALPDQGLPPAELLARATRADVELVVIGGQVKLISPELRSRWRNVLARMETIKMDGVQRWVDAPVSQLLAAAREHLGNDIRLAGKRVTQ